MSITRALLGFLGVGTILVGFGLGAIAGRRRWFPTVGSPVRRLIEMVLALAGILGTSLLLGSIGWFRAEPLILVAVATGVISASMLRSHSAFAASSHSSGNGHGDTRNGRAHPAWVRWAVLIAGGVVAARWVTELLQPLRRGFSHTDVLHYHLTHAAGFAQSGQTWPVRFPSIGDGAAYHPAHSELLHAAGLVVLGSDFLSIFINLAFAAMAMTAGWVIGRHAGNAPAGAIVVAAFLSLESLAAESGSPLNDTMALALLLTAVALFLEAAEHGGHRRLTVLAGVSAGLAAGTKLTVLVPVVGLSVLVAALPGRTRVRSLGIYVSSAALAGGYWYLRNLAATGNPVPALSFGPLPGPDLEWQRSVEFPVTDYLLDRSIWRDYFLPGLGDVFGPLWPLLPVLALVGGLVALTAPVWRTERIWSLLAICGFASVASYLVTPTSAGGFAGAPVLFVFNVRYAFPGLLLCAFAGLAHPAVRRHPERVAAVAVAVFVASNLHGADLRRSVVAVGVVAFAAGVLWVTVRRPEVRPIALALTLVAGLAAAVVVQDDYLDRRWTRDFARWSAYDAMREVRGVRIGVTGFPQNYPFYGPDLSNDVVTLGDDSPGDELVPFDECADFWTTISEARLEIVVVLSERGFVTTDFGRQLITTPSRWLHDAGAPVVFDGRDVQMFDVRGAAPGCL